MPDLVDYVLNERPELADHPRFQELFEALEVDVLDYADYRLREFRESDRLADAMADERWQTWMSLPVTLEELRPGMRVVVGAYHRIGTVLKVETDSLDRVAVHVDLHDWYVRPGNLQRWVPLPLDAATLGERAAR